MGSNRLKLKKTISAKQLDQKKVLFENSFITSQIYKKIIAGHSAIMILTMLTILCSFSIFDLGHSIKDATIDPEQRLKRQKHKNILLFFSSFAAFSLSVLEIICRKNELLYNLYRGEDLRLNRFWSYKNLKPLCLNIFFYMMHPNNLVEYIPIINQKNEIYFTSDNYQISYTLNDILLLLNLLNIIPFFNSMLRYVTYNSDVADRVWQFKKQNKWIYKKCHVWCQVFVQKTSYESIACCLHDQYVYFCDWIENLRILSQFVFQKEIILVKILFIIQILFGLLELR